MGTTTVNPQGAEITPVTKDWFTNAVLTSRREQAPSLRIVEDRQSVPAADAVLEDTKS